MNTLAGKCLPEGLRKARVMSHDYRRLVGSLAYQRGNTSHKQGVWIAIINEKAL
jgi:hypothetical protein